MTHEQADFDALASLLGAALLEPAAHAVLPRRMNRNVRNFVSLHGAELPMQDARDLPAGPIRQVTLVDTQSLVTLRGMTSAPVVRIVDHHTRRTDLNESWEIQIEPVGACTTLLIERLIRQNIPIDGTAATLLLLGIYEDTGSLSYSSTTSRDIRAAAEMLDRGASLKIIGSHLNPPLSAEQMAVFDRLLARAQTIQVQGQQIVISGVEAFELQDEISSIAHKMRDLLDPDGLFLFTATRDGVRLVARSTTDRIDVGRIAAQFGGGGHPRAASALVRIGNQTAAEVLEETQKQLLDLLPGFVTPPITVGQIMSRKPLVLPAGIPVAEAARLMQRYGYEGYPVVRDNRVVGLLTRRAVDRALAHQLKVTAGSIMDGGEVTIYPGDSIEHLQQVMNRSGWGQVPVISPDNDEIIGIVTRTDLLKTLSGAAGGHPFHLNLSNKIETALPHARLALLKAVANQAANRRMAVYIVGGFVRDLLLNHPSTDFDIVVEGDAIALGKTLTSEYGGRLVSHSRFGTAKWQISEIRESLAQHLTNGASVAASDLPEFLDLISARTEFYDYPTALPTVERSSIKLDLHRRDFTINTLALRLDGRHYGELHDHWGGWGDMQRRLVRVLHSLSFVDDPTRMLRAVRFEQRFEFQIEQRTLELIQEARPLLRQISGDRVRHELNLILGEENPQRIFNRLKELDLLSAIHPDLDWRDEMAPPLLRALSQANERPHWSRNLAYLVWLGPQGEEVVEKVCHRLHFSADLHRALVGFNRLWAWLLDVTGAEPVSLLTEKLDSAPPEALAAAELMALPDASRAALQQYLDQWRSIHPFTSGSDLRERGLPPGPVYSQILHELRSAWLDGLVKNGDEEQLLLNRLIREIGD